MKSCLISICFLTMYCFCFSQQVNYTATILGDRVNLRTAPSLNSNIVGKLSLGQTCNVLLKGPKAIIGNNEDYWYHIEVAVSGIQGYVYGQYLSKPNEENASSQIYMLVVGVGEYSQEMVQKGFGSVPVSLGAKRIYQFYKSKKGGNLPDRNIIFLRDSESTKYKILSSLDYISKIADEDDVVMFYYTGHGHISILSAYDEIIGHDVIHDILKSSNAKRKIWIADSCHSASANSALDNIEKSNSLLKSLDSFDADITYISSSKSKEVSFALPTTGAGLFTTYWLLGLEGDADKNSDYLVTIDEAFQFASDHVLNFSQTHYKQEQSPQLGGLVDLQLPIAKVY